MRTLILLLSITLLSFSCHTTKQAGTNENASNDSYENIKSNSDIKLKSAIYKLDTPILIDGKENVIIDGNGATFIMQSLADDVILVRNSKNVILKNFKATHIEPEGPVGCTGNVIHIDGGSNIIIENCELNGSGIVGIAAYDTKNLKVEKNHIHKNSEYGIIYQGPSIQIEGNVFENNANGHLYFSYNDTSWPPQHLINSDKNMEGLSMARNVFK